jgi:hypothetical protein
MSRSFDICMHRRRANNAGSVLHMSFRAEPSRPYLPGSTSHMRSFFIHRNIHHKISRAPNVPNVKRNAVVIIGTLLRVSMIGRDSSSNQKLSFFLK